MRPNGRVGLIFIHCCCCCCFSRVRLCATPQTAAHQAPRPWDSPGKNTGVGCHFLLQCMKVKSESQIAQSCLTLRDPMDCSPPGFSAHGIFQARVLEWGAIAFSALRYSPWLKPGVSYKANHLRAGLKLVFFFSSQIHEAVSSFSAPQLPFLKSVDTSLREKCPQIPGLPSHLISWFQNYELLT